MLLRRYSSFLHISLVLTWNMILFEAKYHLKKAIFIGTIFLWNVFLFWVIWFTYSSDKMSTLCTIAKDYDKNIVLRDCQRQAFEYLHDKKGNLLVTTFGTTFETFTEIESLQEPTILYGRLNRMVCILQAHTLFSWLQLVHAVQSWSQWKVKTRETYLSFTWRKILFFWMFRIVKQYYSVAIYIYYAKPMGQNILDRNIEI